VTGADPAGEPARATGVGAAANCLAVTAAALLATGVQIEQFDPLADTQRLRQCHQMLEAGRPADHPSLSPQSFEDFTRWWAHGYDGSPRQTWLASNGSGEPVGCYLLALPAQENTTMARCALVVAPARRRAGAGRALLAHCAAQARRAGRRRLASESTTRAKVREGSPGAAFAADMGASTGIAEVIRALDVDAGLLAGLASLRADAERHSCGYALLSWLGASPDEHIDQVARVNDAMSDAPRDAGVQPQAWDADRIRSLEQTAIAHGLCFYSVAARHLATGDFAALTQITADPGTPGWGIQQITAVTPEHRGHRLGLLVKIAMLELLTGCGPDVRRILTGNAGSNEHMIAINAQLGYQVSAVYRSWELDLAAAGSAAQS
jgi:GNAT superfamily N-acetyltransferase